MQERRRRGRFPHTPVTMVVVVVVHRAITLVHSGVFGIDSKIRAERSVELCNWKSYTALELRITSTDTLENERKTPGTRGEAKKRGKGKQTQESPFTTYYLVQILL